jgi:hypothetical protein
MMKKILSLLFMISMLLGSNVSGQDKPDEKPKYGWQREMIGGFNLTQSSFDNWVQGGENQLTWQVYLNFKFVNDQATTNWANSGKLSYGTTKVAKEQAKKSIDDIKLESVYTYKLGVLINPYVAATGETQFAPGYNYSTQPRTEISAFMDPGFFQESAGVGIKPNEIVQTSLGVALKQTITSNHPDPYADNPKTTKIEKFKNEVGAESVTNVKWKVSENSLFTSNLSLFSDLKAFNTIDVNWDNLLATKISKYFVFNFNFDLFYDRDFSKSRQLKEVIALGVTYSFL